MSLLSCCHGSVAVVSTTTTPWAVSSLGWSREIYLQIPIRWLGSGSSGPSCKPHLARYPLSQIQSPTLPKVSSEGDVQVRPLSYAEHSEAVLAGPMLPVSISMFEKMGRLVGVEYLSDDVQESHTHGTLEGVSMRHTEITTVETRMTESGQHQTIYRGRKDTDTKGNDIGLIARSSARPVSTWSLSETFRRVALGLAG